MKKLLFGFAVACLAILQIRAAESDWMTDLPKAQEKAKAEKKFVFMDFTGSDWCPPCMQLHKDVLTTAQFEEYAKKNLVLVVVDFPNEKKQPNALAIANDKLKDKFNVDAYPTLILLDGDGKEIWRQRGYRGQGPAKFIATLEEAQKSPKK